MQIRKGSVFVLNLCGPTYITENYANWRKFVQQQEVLRPNVAAILGKQIELGILIV